MAVRNRRAPRRARQAKRKGRKSRVPRGINPAKQTALIVESFAINDSSAAGTVGLLPNVVYPTFVSLSNFPRAELVSANFKWYKCVEIEYKYTPRFNLFSEDGVGGSPSSVPYFYSLMNRTAETYVPNVTPISDDEFMLSSGAKPRSFTKPIVLRYKPNWNSPGLFAMSNAAPGAPPMQVTAAGLKAEYGWLATPHFKSPTIAYDGILDSMTPSNTIPPIGVYPGFTTTDTIAPQHAAYQGHMVLIQQANASSTVLSCCDLVVTAKWIFKGQQGWSTNAPRVDVSGVDVAK
jgi:hypothetical protein